MKEEEGEGEGGKEGADRQAGRKDEAAVSSEYTEMCTWKDIDSSPCIFTHGPLRMTLPL